MNHGFTKLFSSIVTSTIWAETNPTRIVWITMMALADRSGEVAASVPGLARAANVTLLECEAALKAFMSPDAYSRTKEQEGRRIEEIDGGWRLLNHAKYRDAMRSLDRTEYLRQKQAEHRARKKTAALSTMSTASTNGNHGQSIAEAEAEAEVKTGRAVALPDESWIASLRSSPAYAGVDVDREIAKCKIWCETKRKMFSRRRIMYWLNNAERPMGGLFAQSTVCSEPANLRRQ